MPIYKILKKMNILLKLIGLIAIAYPTWGYGQTNSFIYKPNFFQSVSILPIWNKAVISGIPDNVEMNARNFGMDINLNFGAVFDQKFALSAGSFIGANPFGYKLSFNEADYGLGNSTYFDEPVIYGFTTGFMFKAEYFKRITNSVRLKTGAGLNLKYFIYGGVNRGVHFFINDTTNFNFYTLNLPVETITEKGFTNLTASIGISKQLKHTNRYYFVEIVGNLSKDPITEGTIDFFTGESYESNGTFIQKGHYIGINTGFLFISD